jgi:transcriptional regulator with GAF, ATPase, and Fis domain
VRELRHVLEAAALLADGRRIAPEHLDLAGAAAPKHSGAYQASIEDARRRMMVEALEVEGGNAAAAARRLGMSRQNFSYLAKRLGIGGAQRARGGR